MVGGDDKERLSIGGADRSWLLSDESRGSPTYGCNCNCGVLYPDGACTEGGVGFVGQTIVNGPCHTGTSSFFLSSHDEASVMGPVDTGPR